jgi:2-amino-4-hydroxy-6-hydroxymethyldihydropteridine diphosphokinase
LVALGGNLGEPREHLERAVHEIAAVPGVRILRRSSWHATEPVGGPSGQPRFLNGVVLLETTLEPRELLERLQAIERAHGRDRRRETRPGPRTLDRDLLFHGERASAEPDLAVPHPRLEDRAFVLAPLAEIEPERVLPRCGRTVRERLDELAASGGELGGRAEAGW